MGKQRTPITAEQVAEAKLRAELAEFKNKASVARLTGTLINRRAKAIQGLTGRRAYGSPTSAPLRFGEGSRGRGMFAYSGGYSSVSRTRTSSGRARGRGGSFDSHLDGQTLDAMRRDSQDLERNSLIAAAMLDRVVDMVTGGPGFSFHASTESPEWNALANGMFGPWARNEGELPCEVRGMMDLNDCLASALRQSIRDGDLICGPTEFGQLQFTDGERIINPNRGLNTRDLVNGVELDGFGAPKAFWIAEYMNDGATLSSKATRLDAKDAWFLAHTKFFSQTRGVPRLALMTEPIQRLDDYIESTELAAYIATCVGLVTKTEDPTIGGLGLPTQDVPRGDGITPEPAEVEMQPFMSARLKPGESIEQVKPEQPTTQFDPFVVMQLRILGLRLDLPIELALLHFGLTNFHSSKSALTIAWRSFERLVKWVVKLARKIYIWRIGRWIEQGKLPKRADWFEHTITPPPPPVLDPVAQLQAYTNEITVGLSSRTEICARMGKVFREVAKQCADDQAVMDEYGLKFGALPGAAPAPVAGPGQEQGQGSAAKGAKGAKEDEDGNAEEAEDAGDAEKTGARR